MIMQSPFILSLLSASLSTLIISLTFLYLYFKEKRPYLLIWFIAWVLYALRFASSLTFGESHNAWLPLGLRQILALGNGVMLLLGTRQFMKKTSGIAFWLSFAPFLAWIVLASFLRLDYLWLVVPIFLLLGYIFVRIGLYFIVYQPAPYFTRLGIGLAMIVWGLHKFDYPFLARDPYWATIGFTVGYCLELCVAIGMILLHYEMNKKLLQKAEEERIRIEQRIHQTAKLQALGQMAGGVAHDFNNQLAGIMGYAELCQQECGTSPAAQDYLRQIIAASRRSADLIEQLLTFARKGLFRSEPTSVHAVIGDVLNMLKRSVSKKIVLVTDLKAGRDIVSGDRSHLHNALLNIALNSCDAMPLGGTLTLSTENDPSRRFIQVCVHDTGVGMSAEIKAHILEPFFTTKPTGSGSGMGLPAAYGTISKHGGDLQVESQPEQGSRFIISLPLCAETDSAPVAPPLVDEAADPAATSSLHILVIDDERSVLDILGRMLTRLGHRPQPFTDPIAAQDYFRQHHAEIDLIISDLVMPELNGFELLLRLQSQSPGIRAIICSGYGDPLDREDYSRSDLTVVRKPFSLNALREGIAKAMQPRYADKIKP